MYERDCCTRRGALKGLGAVVAGSSLFAGSGAASDAYGTVVNVVEEGGDPTGEESITPILREHAGDDTRFEFPPGRYRMSEQFRWTGFDHVAFVGDDATIVPDDYYDFDGDPLCFKLGTYYSPGRDLRFEGIDFDFTADDTGARAIQAQIADDLLVHDVTVHGEHDSGTWGPFLFDVTDPDGDGWIDGLEIPDGGEYSEHCPGDIHTGPTGVLVTRYHEGHLRMLNCVVGPFPDNGLYARNGARTTVYGGEYRNSNVASIRLGGDSSGIRNATVVVDHNRSEDQNQTAIRLDRGDDLRVWDTEIRLAAPNGNAINVQNDVDSASIRRSSIDVGEETCNAVEVHSGAGQTDIIDTDVQFDGGGNAILLHPRSDGGGEVLCEYVTIAGDAHGYDGRHAIRCERAGSEFRAVSITQHGDGYRRCLEISGDDCLVYKGKYRSTHHPIVNNASGTRIIEANHVEADNGRQALKLLDGHSDVSVVRNVLYEGFLDKGTEDLTMYGNETPSH